jgi:hypothetical protein
MVLLPRTKKIIVLAECGRSSVVVALNNAPDFKRHFAHSLHRFRGSCLKTGYPERAASARQDRLIAIKRIFHLLGRYTHCVAISNNRLLRFDGDSALFQWKDYRQPHCLSERFSL